MGHPPGDQVEGRTHKLFPSTSFHASSTDLMTNHIGHTFHRFNNEARLLDVAQLLQLVQEDRALATVSLAIKEKIAIQSGEMFSRQVKKFVNLLRLSPKGAKLQEWQSLLGKSISQCITQRKKTEAKMTILRKDVAQFLQLGQEDRALTTVSLAIKEKSAIESYDLLQSYCEKLIGEVHTLIEERECPIILKEAVASLIYATSRCTARLTELSELRMLFITQFGKKFVEAAANNETDGGVSSQLVEILSRHKPTLEYKLEIMKGIASDFNVNWRPTQSQA
ncbi:hypothetical protein GOP47_0015299 [Adiantum capillus-veneris]|uniref:Uncharacterized protein n=1 Tax=Adiantum capillus-veneris TaxID=13818 RepID=A0A9D4UJE2_ADICA|nr:hypothetical protein GOP47_0015299 [Adiantum capillus-veneris]